MRPPRDHRPWCPRLQVWDAGDWQAPCLCDQRRPAPGFWPTLALAVLVTALLLWWVCPARAQSSACNYPEARVSAEDRAYFSDAGVEGIRLEVWDLPWQKAQQRLVAHAVDHSALPPGPAAQELDALGVISALHVVKARLKPTSISRGTQDGHGSTAATWQTVTGSPPTLGQYLEMVYHDRVGRGWQADSTVWPRRTAVHSWYGQGGADQDVPGNKALWSRETWEGYLDQRRAYATQAVSEPQRHCYLYIDREEWRQYEDRVLEYLGEEPGPPEPPEPPPPPEPDEGTIPCVRPRDAYRLMGHVIATRASLVACQGELQELGEAPECSTACAELADLLETAGEQFPRAYRLPDGTADLCDGEQGDPDREDCRWRFWPAHVWERIKGLETQCRGDIEAGCRYVPGLPSTGRMDIELVEGGRP